MWLTPRVLFSKTKADMHLFPDTPTYNRLIAKNLRNNGETCR